MAIEFVTKNSPGSFLAKREEQNITFDPDTLTPPFPKNALVELSNWCNHACVFCTNPRMVRKKGFLDFELYKRFITEAAALGLEECGLYTTGEPFFTKNLHEFVKFAKDAGVRYVYITSNGALATPDRVIPVIEAGVSSLKFSVNAGSRRTYKEVHGKDDFDKVIEHIKFISEYRREKAPHLRLMTSTVITKFTEGEKEALRELLLPLVDEMVFVGVGNQAGQSLDYLELLECGMTDAFPEMGKAKPCSMLWNRVHLTWEGFFSLCCLDYENVLTYADLSQSSVKEAWQNQLIQEMRKRHQSQKLGGTLCENCLYGVKDKVYPISAIGHASTGLEVASTQTQGVESVKARIENLSQ